MQTPNKKDHRGYLHYNQTKNKPTQPDLIGNITIDGVEWRLAAWENKTPEGKKYLSITSSPPQPKNSNQNDAPASAGDTHNTQNNNTNQDLSDLDDILNSTGNPF